MPTDPKFRVIAKRSGRPVAEVLAVFTAMLVNASANEAERGTLRGWCHEDIAASLDMETEHAESIYVAMQGKILDGDTLTGWDRRQPKREREDDSADRVAAHRERKKNVTPCNAIEDRVTPCNALEERREEEIREEEISEVKCSGAVSVEPAKKPKRGSRLSDDWTLPDDWRAWTQVNCPISTAEAINREALSFANYWQALPGSKACKLDWQKTWRNWCLKAFSTAPLRPSQGYQSATDKFREGQRSTMAIIDAMFPQGAVQ